MKRIVLALLLTLAVFAASLPLKAQPPESRSSSPEFVSEVIPIKYAVAADVAAVLNGLPMTHNSSSIEPTTVLFQRLQRLLDAARQVERLGMRNIEIDERSNTLIVSASPSDLAAIKQIIARLDVVLPQILIDAAILEVPLNVATNPPRSAAQSRRKSEESASTAGLAKLSFGPGVGFEAGNPTKPSDPQCRFCSVAPVAGDLFAAVDAFVTNAGATVRSRPRIQTSDSIPAAFWWGVLSGPFVPLPSADMTICLTCSIMTNNCMLIGIQQSAGTRRRIGAAESLVYAPVATSNYSCAKIKVRDSETVMLGGAVETFRTPLFSRVELLDHVPWAGSLLNDAITYPTRKNRVGVMVLFRATVISPPPRPP